MYNSRCLQSVLFSRFLVFSGFHQHFEYCIKLLVLKESVMKKVALRGDRSGVGGGAGNNLGCSVAELTNSATSELVEKVSGCECELIEHINRLNIRFLLHATYFSCLLCPCSSSTCNARVVRRSVVILLLTVNLFELIKKLRLIWW